jgi:hypothetical protein
MAARIFIVIVLGLVLYEMNWLGFGGPAWWPLQIILDALALTGAALLILPRRLTFIPMVAGILIVYGALAAYENTRITGYHDVVLGRYRARWTVAGYAYRTEDDTGNLASHFFEITGKEPPEPEWEMSWSNTPQFLGVGPLGMNMEFEGIWRSYVRTSAPLEVKKRVVEAAAEKAPFTDNPEYGINPFIKRAYLVRLYRYLDSFDTSGNSSQPFPEAQEFAREWYKDAGKR